MVPHDVCGRDGGTGGEGGSGGRGRAGGRGDARLGRVRWVVGVGGRGVGGLAVVAGTQLLGFDVGAMAGSVGGGRGGGRRADGALAAPCGRG